MNCSYTKIIHLLKFHRLKHVFQNHLLLPYFFLFVTPRNSLMLFYQLIIDIHLQVLFSYKNNGNFTRSDPFLSASLHTLCTKDL
jgi:hypothetical protein